MTGKDVPSLSISTLGCASSSHSTDSVSQELGISALKPDSKTTLDQIFSSHHPKEADEITPADRAAGQGAQRSPSKL